MSRVPTVPPRALRFLPPILCQVGLPRKQVAGRDFVRTSGDAWISVSAGFLDVAGHGRVLQPIPYGPLPRLALAWISTQAVRTKSPEIVLGDSAADFLRALGHGADGRRYRAMDRQMHALAACDMRTGFRGTTTYSKPIRTFQDWQPLRELAQRPLWQGRLLLGQEYYQALLNSPVPLDAQALLTLKGTALGLDIYVWMAYRLCWLEAPLTLSWAALAGQFGHEYANPKDFRKAFLAALAKVGQAYPQAKPLPVHGGLRFFPAAPPIPFK